MQLPIEIAVHLDSVVTVRTKIIISGVRTRSTITFIIMIEALSSLIVMFDSPCPTPTRAITMPGRLCRYTTRQTSDDSSPARVRLARWDGKNTVLPQSRGHDSPPRGDVDG
uniref:Uncharacterized protein n=1 Tax=Trichogramma kaykai TaxID=54128 RepID=A0ABD2W5F4_9HYME